jgi:hypothetical protein
MGGSSTTTATPNIPPELAKLYGQVTELAGAGMPQAKSLLTGALGGGQTPEFQRFQGKQFLPYALAQQRAEQAVMRATPRGGAQVQALAEMNRDIGVQRASAEVQHIQHLMDLYFSLLGGFNPAQAIGRTQTTDEPFVFGLDLGPIKTSIPL